MTILNARIAIDKYAHRKAQVLASRAVRYGGFEQIADLVRFLLDDAWQDALSAGLVQDGMLDQPGADERGRRTESRDRRTR